MHYFSTKSSPPPLPLPSKQTLIPFSLSFPSSLSPPFFSPPSLTSPQNQSVQFSFSPPHMANSGSGMAVDGNCKAKFMELKTKRNYRFVVFKIDEKEMKISVDSVGLPDENYDDFTACLPPNECRYAVYDFDFITSENCNKSKIFFIAWSPDTSKVRSKMLYASSKERFKRELDGIQVELQATEPSEMSLEIVRGRAL